ncbi:hypothetical protein BDV3_005042 [Batrachochytrium dendrobatidis]
MSSLIVPIACWQTPPQSKLTCATSTDDGAFVVSGSKCGTISIYSVDHTNAQLVPRSVSIGHSNEISVLLLCCIEVESASTKQNIVLSGSQDGEISMWDIADGRCLQSNPHAIDCVPSGILKTTNGKYLFCYGLGSHITILDSSTLEVVKKFALFSEQWFASASLYSTDNKKAEQIIAVTFDGYLHQLIFDENIMTFTHDPQAYNLHLPEHTAAFDLQQNRFDKHIICVLQHKFCSVFVLNKTTSNLLVCIECPGPKRSWAGFKFLSERTMILWTTDGTSHVYYLGPADDLNSISCLDIPNDVIALVSDGKTAVYVNQSKITINSYQDYKKATCIAVFDTSNSLQSHLNMHVLICVVEANLAAHQNSMLLLRFEMEAQSTFRLTQTHFWASLLGQNVRNVCMPNITDKENLAQISLAATNRTTPEAKQYQFEMLSIASNVEIAFQDLWPVQHMSGTRATAATLILRKHIVLGHEDGSIVVAPASVPIFSHQYDRSGLQPDHTHYDRLQNNSSDDVGHQDVSDSLICILRGHKNAITALFVPHFRTDGVRERLLSGSRDGIVKLWNVSSGELLGSFLCHSMPVISFTPMPSESGAKFKASVISVALDHSVSIIDADEGVCQYKFASHQSAIEAFYVRPLDDMFVVECIDGTLYVWQTKTGHLDRIVTGALAHDIISGCEIKAQCRQSLDSHLAANVRRTLSIYPVTASPQVIPTMLVYQVNIKRLIDEIANGERVLTPVLSRKGSAASPFNSAATETPPSPQSSQTKRIALKRLFSRKKSAHKLSINPSKSIEESSQGSQAARKSNSGRPLSLVRGAIPDSVMTHAVLSALLSWGFDPELDRMCSDKLDLYPPSCCTSVGFRGANGYLSFPVPSKHGLFQSIQNGWRLSEFTTALKLLAIVSLCRSVLSSTDLETEVSQLLALYGVRLPDLVGYEYVFPSIAFLAKYWQDPVANVQESSRVLLESSITKMSERDKASTVSYWRPYLPWICKSMSKMNLRAALVLGIIGSSSFSPLNIHVCKEVAESLDMIIREDLRGSHRLTAMELIGRAFAIWEPHINGASVLRYLVSQTGLVAIPSSIQATTPSGGPMSITVIPAGFSQSGGSAVPSPGTSLSPSLQVFGQSQPPSITPAIMLMARQAIVNIASINAGLFISTLTFDLVHARLASERTSGLKLLGMFITKKPAILYPYLVGIVDAMVKTLDPNTPNMREALQQLVTVNFAELVRTYPSVSFHAGTQRLAVGGSSDGFVIVHDLRTATRAFILRGHTRPVHAVSFSNDGKLMATFSINENCVKIWQLHVGFLGALVDAWSGSNSNISSVGGATSSSAFSVAGVSSLGAGVGISTAGSIKCFRSFNVGAPIEHVPFSSMVKDVKFVWIGDRAVKIHSLENFEFTFNI